MQQGLGPLSRVGRWVPASELLEERFERLLLILVEAHEHPFELFSDAIGLGRIDSSIIICAEQGLHDDVRDLVQVL